MKEITKYLLHFMDEEFINNNQKLWNNPIGSDNLQYTHIFFENILNNIKKGEIEYQKKYSFILKQELLLTKTEFPKSDDYNYIPQSIRNNLENKSKKGYHYKFSIFEQEIDLYIIYPLEKYEDINITTNNKWSTFFNLCLYKIYLWLYVVYPYKNKVCSQQLKIYLYFTEIPKLLDNKKSIVLNQEMVNTAFTYPCRIKDTIIIFRQEEWFKVLIHESFHCLGLDYSNSLQLDNFSKIKISELFTIKSDILLSETYTELNAEILNVIFYIFFSTKKNNDVENYNKICFKKFEKYMNYEQIFSCFQCAKVLHYNKTTYQEIISKKENNFKEETNVFVYYILKSILITNYIEYLEWIKNKNNGSLRIIQTEKHINSFIDLIRKNYMNSNYLQKMEFMENWFKNNKNKNSIESKTLRMSLIEL